MSVECVKCGATMRCGYIAEHDANEIVPMSSGNAWKPSKLGKVFKTAELVAYACPECGYIKLRIKDITKYRDKILLAPSTCQ